MLYEVITDFALVLRRPRDVLIGILGPQGHAHAEHDHAQQQIHNRITSYNVCYTKLLRIAMK